MSRQTTQEAIAEVLAAMGQPAPAGQPDGKTHFENLLKKVGAGANGVQSSHTVGPSPLRSALAHNGLQNGAAPTAVSGQVCPHSSSTPPAHSSYVMDIGYFQSWAVNVGEGTRRVVILL
jgi:hypothetical protein